MEKSKVDKESKVYVTLEKDCYVGPNYTLVTSLEAARDFITIEAALSECQRIVHFLALEVIPRTGLYLWGETAYDAAHRLDRESQ